VMPDRQRAMQSEPRSASVITSEAAAQCVTNWAAYYIALRQRARLSVWFTEATIAVWEGGATRYAPRPAALLGVGDHNGAVTVGGAPAWRYARPKG
jgi:hypothetical protein